MASADDSCPTFAALSCTAPRNNPSIHSTAGGAVAAAARRHWTFKAALRLPISLCVRPHGRERRRGAWGRAAVLLGEVRRSLKRLCIALRTAQRPVARASARAARVRPRWTVSG